MTEDAFLVSMSAVLQHMAIHFNFRLSSKTEWNYVQIGQEEQAVIFGISEFHEYIYGWGFTIIMDHKPMLRFFKKGLCNITGTECNVGHWFY